MSTKINNDLTVLGAVMQESQTEKFIQKTKASSSDASKYLGKYNNLEKAVSKYLEHQKMV